MPRLLPLAACLGLSACPAAPPEPARQEPAKQAPAQPEPEPAKPTPLEPAKPTPLEPAKPTPLEPARPDPLPVRTRTYPGDPAWAGVVDPNADREYDCYLGDYTGVERRITYRGADAALPVYTGDPEKSPFPGPQRGTFAVTRDQLLATGTAKRPIGDVTRIAGRPYRVTRACTAPCQPDGTGDTSPFSGCDSLALRPDVGLYVFTCSDLTCEADYGDSTLEVVEEHLVRSPYTAHACLADNLRGDGDPPQDTWWIPVDGSDGRGWLDARADFQLEIRCVGGDGRDRASRAWHRYQPELP